MTLTKIMIKVINFRIKRFLLLSIVTIILSVMGCAIQKEDSAGKINSVYIKRQDFMNSLRGHFTGYVLEKDRTPGDAEKRELFRQTWKDITIHVILKDYFKKYDISVTKQEVLDTLLNNVPASIMKAPLFQTNGSFDKALYVQELLSDSSQKLDWLKRHYYDYYIPIEKLKEKLQAKSFITKKELKDLDSILNSSVDVEWIVFDPAKAMVSVSQSEIENYYHGHLEDFQIRPYASLSWVAVPVTMSDIDAYRAQAKIDSLYFQITNGASFTAMAERFSQAKSAKSGGALGFIKIDELSPTTSKIIEGLEKNQVSRPVKLTNSWVLYQLVERTKNLVKLNELVIKIIPGEESKLTTKENAIHLRDLAMQLGLETAALEMDFTYKQSGKVAKDSLWLKDGDLSAYLIDRAYTQKAGAILEPVYSETMRSWIVTSIIDVQPFQHKPLYEISELISAKLMINKQIDKAMGEARTWAQKYKNKQIDYASNQDLDMIKTPSLVFAGTVLNMPIRNIFVKIVSDYKQSQAQTPYQIGDKVLLPIVSNVKTITPPLLTQNEVREYYFDYLNPQWFDQWLKAEIKKADVKIWITYP